MRVKERVARLKAQSINPRSSKSGKSDSNRTSSSLGTYVSPHFFTARLTQALFLIRIIIYVATVSFIAISLVSRMSKL